MDHHSQQPTVLSSPPAVTDFTPLSDHESSTPAAFFGGTPVLHAALGVCDLLISDSDTKKWDVFRALAGTAAGVGQAQEASNGPSQPASIAEMRVIGSISGFVTSSSLVLTNPPPRSDGSTTHTQTAISIPYPCISLHATQRLYASPSPPVAAAEPQQPSQSVFYSTEPTSDSSVAADSTENTASQTQAVYLQLDMDPAARERSNDDAGDEEMGGSDEQTVEILLVPQAHVLGNGSSSSATAEGNAAKVKEIFEALSRCADLHPDPAMDEQEEGSGGGAGGLAALLGLSGGSGMPGEGGWITSENAHEFEAQFGGADLEGEEVYDGDEGVVEPADGIDGLGPGAGSRRNIDEVAADGVAGANGDGEETKWQRTG